MPRVILLFRAIAREGPQHRVGSTGAQHWSSVASKPRSSARIAAGEIVSANYTGAAPSMIAKISAGSESSSRSISELAKRSMRSIFAETMRCASHSAQPSSASSFDGACSSSRLKTHERSPEIIRDVVAGLSRRELGRPARHSHDVFALPFGGNCAVRRRSVLRASEGYSVWRLIDTSTTVTRHLFLGRAFSAKHRRASKRLDARLHRHPWERAAARGQRGGTSTSYHQTRSGRKNNVGQ